LKLLAATQNRRKLEELRRILDPIGIEVCTPKALGIEIPEVEETGETFAQNAALKARSACEASGLPALAEDSGLCVFALNGAPGIYSARYSGAVGENRDRENLNLLLCNMKKFPREKRSAKFVCAICVVYPDGRILEVCGEAHGEIAFEPSGENGFGYDPVFLTEKGSFANLSPEEKDKISHRGQALRKLAERLPEMGKTLIFGGTFNPVHNGHIALCENAVRLLGAQSCVMIPSYLPPHKSGKSVAAGEHRVNMCRLAVKDKPGFSVSDLEINRGGKSYTVETLRELKSRIGDMPWFLCGADMFVTLPEWHKYEEIITLAVLCGAPREGLGVEQLEETARKIRQDGGQARVLEIPILNISSSQIREILQTGGDASAFLPPLAAQYIIENRLYV
jgi:XTP/dITP diphosphohydrolase